ncbi:Uncharacterized protein family Ycf33 [Macleaya cordata]|uniref:Uncharacterized protein ycf33 n=1 Tax=Macleaya cordata TaxID=56857 RepID=A0A200QNL0_MACCD|nr:Uncharacterized protein family Ycf33 [Macleaya cordata]
MKAFTLRPQFYFPKQSNLKTPKTKTLHFLPIKTTSYPKHHSNSNPPYLLTRTTTNPKNKNLILEHTPITKILSQKEESIKHSSDGFSRVVILGAVTVGFAMFVVGMDDQKAWALGPEGPLMEEFWDNMRRYGLYILTVSTGVIYTIFQPILELLKNPISAILIIAILGGSFYIVSQVLSAMVGVSEFVYDYGY